MASIDKYINDAPPSVGRWCKLDPGLKSASWFQKLNLVNEEKNALNLNHLVSVSLHTPLHLGDGLEAHGGARAAAAAGERVRVAGKGGREKERRAEGKGRWIFQHCFFKEPS